MFNIDTSQNLLLGYYGDPRADAYKQNNFTLCPNFDKNPISNCLIYSDLVENNMRYGEQTVNLLDFIPSPDNLGSHNKQTFANPRIRSNYRPLKNNYIADASFVLTDINGQKIVFENSENSSGEYSNTHTALNTFLQLRIRRRC